MSEKDFKDQIKEELKELTKNQVVLFAWLCAMRALPFVGSQGHFKFWKQNDRQKHIYSLFYALDTVSFFTYFSVGNGISMAYSAASAAFSASTFASAASASAGPGTTPALAIFTAAAAAAAASEAINYITYAASAATAAADSAPNTMIYSIQKDIKSILLQDLRTIKNNSSSYQQISAEWYKENWVKFQKALEDEECSYWGRLYKEIIENGFKVDKKALEKRLNVPKEIKDQGAAEVARYLEALEAEGTAKLNEARIIILGDKGAGKTCLARRLIDPDAPMTTEKESTPGVDTLTWELKQENINVHIWDFAGHTITHAVHRFFLSERCLYIIVYDGRTEERNRLDYWLNLMKNYGGDSRAFILVNKRDQHSPDIPINSLKEQFSIEGFYTFSIQDDKTELLAFRNQVASCIKNNPSWNQQLIPSHYFKVKTDLENLFSKCGKEKGAEYISKEKFISIAGKYNIDNFDDLLKSLHALGISLWYKDMEKCSTLVLNPEWISHGVYRLINWAHEAKRHFLTLNDFKAVFGADPDRYPVDKHEFLFELMKHYELAYETKHENKLIIPHLLKEDRPEILPDFPAPESLMLRYKAETPLPPNTISRFIVRHNQEIRIEEGCPIVWRFGVVLEDKKGSLALVREEKESHTISVSVKGANRTNYISALRETLNDIFNSYKSAKPELQYRIEPPEHLLLPIEKKRPLWLTDSKILRHSLANEPYYEDLTGQRIPMQQTVHIYNITAQNLIMNESGISHIGDQSNSTFNFNNCTIGLQGNLNELARLLTKSGNDEEAIELVEAANLLDQAEKSENKEEIKRKGLLNSLGRIVDELSSEGSTLNKTVKGIKNGIKIAGDIVQGYNKISQLFGLS